MRVVNVTDLLILQKESDKMQIRTSTVEEVPFCR
jgi:hypothetical protein